MAEKGAPKIAEPQKGEGETKIFCLSVFNLHLPPNPRWQWKKLTQPSRVTCKNFRDDEYFGGKQCEVFKRLHDMVGNGLVSIGWVWSPPPVPSNSDYQHDMKHFLGSPKQASICKDVTGKGKTTT